MIEKLIELSTKIMEERCCYTRSEIERKINERAKTPVDASRIFDIMYKERLIDEVKGWYFLANSTPF